MTKQWSSPPQMQIDTSKTYTATFKTEHGDIVVDLFTDKAPITVNNFVFLAREGYFNDTTFHRVIADFMVQGGDPTGTGRGTPGYRYDDEPGALAGKHDGPGVLSCANAGPNTNGGQFFITHVPTPWLDGKHGVFGKVSSGMDVVMAIRVRDPQSGGPASKLHAVEITES